MTINEETWTGDMMIEGMMIGGEHYNYRDRGGQNDDRRRYFRAK